MNDNKNIQDKLWDVLNSSEKDKGILEGYANYELRDMKKHLNNIKQQAGKGEPDWDNLWNKVESEAFKIEKKSPKYKIQYRILRYAAAIAVVFGMSFLTYHMINTFDNGDSQKYSKVETIAPGTKSAKLILADGKSIELSKEKLGNIIEDKSVVVVNDSTELLAYKTKTENKESSINSTKLEYNTIVVPRAGEYSVRLSDGTVVFLNSESELKYPVHFSGNERKVYLKGEAYFNVKRNVNKPFRVQLKDMSVEVLGTSFNVNSYEENEGIQTTLVKGKVRVFENSNKRNSVILNPNQQAEFSGKKLTVRDVDVEQYVSWKDGKFYFKDMSLEKVMIQMERWYGIDVFYVNQDIKEFPFTGVINKIHRAEDIFDMIEKVTDVKIRKKGKSIYIEKR